MQDMFVRIMFLNPEVGVRDKPTDLLLVSAVFWCLGRGLSVTVFLASHVVYLESHFASSKFGHCTFGLSIHDD